jgi:O-antigen/teichoic acid export membrane protein
VLLVGALFTAVETAHFGLALSALALVGGVVGSFTGTLMPLASASAAVGDTESCARQYLAGTRVALFLGLPLSVLLVMEGPQLVTVWLGAEVGRPAGQILEVLAAAQVFVISNSAGVPVALGIGLHRIAAAMAVLEGLSNVALSYGLALRWGVLGVAVGTLVPSALFHGLAWFLIIRRALSLSWRRYWSEALRPNIACLLCSFTLWGLLRLAGSPSVGWLFWRAAAFVVFYWMVGLYLCFPPEERTGLRAKIWGPSF